MDAERERRLEDDADLESLPTSFPVRKKSRKFRLTLAPSTPIAPIIKLANIPETPESDELEAKGQPRTEYPFPRSPTL